MSRRPQMLQGLESTGVLAGRHLDRLWAGEHAGPTCPRAAGCLCGALGSQSISGSSTAGRGGGGPSLTRTQRSRCLSCRESSADTDIPPTDPRQSVPTSACLWDTAVSPVSQMSQSQQKTCKYFRLGCIWLHTSANQSWLLGLMSWWLGWSQGPLAEFGPASLCPQPLGSR